MSRALGVFGGSFDPVHYGHLRVAEEAREHLGLARVLFIPAATPPHKPRRQLADAALRLEMVRLAVAENPSFEALSIDVDRGGVSYSVDLLDELAASHERRSLHFLIGVDAFREIHTWYDYERIFELANVVVLSRPTDGPAISSIDHLPVAVKRRFCYQSDTRFYLHAGGRLLRFLSVTALDVSATDIRRRLSDGQSIRYLVPEPVASFLYPAPPLRNRRP